MIHVTPPQRAPEFVADSPLADQAGYLEIDQTTLRHARYPNIFGLGDSASTPNAKTAAAARKQAPIVAVNLLSVLSGGDPVAGYDGYGSCPLTVERGKIVLAEFGYGGRSEEHTSELQSLMRISYAVFCLKKKKNTRNTNTPH